jgi:2'-5' RNA ligase
MGITIVGDRLKILRGLQQWRDKYSMAYQHSAKTQQHSGPTTSSLPMSSSGHTPPVRLPLSDSALTTAITRTTPSSLAVSAESDSNKADPSMLLNCVPVTLSAPTPSSFSSEQTSECYEEHNLNSQLLADMTLLHTLHTQYCHKFNELFERLNRQLETMAKSQKIAPRPRVNVSNSGADAPSASLQSSNYFVSLRINNKDVQRRVSEIQAKLKEIVPGVAKYLLPVEQLHFTLARLALHTPQQVESAKQILDFVGSDIYRAIYKGKPMTVTFKGFSNYGDNVIFIEVEKGENRDLLTEFGSAVFEHFRSANLTSKDSFRFLPAVPILRTKSKGTAGKKKLLALTETHPKFLSSYDHTILGVQTFSAVEISDHVSKQYDKDGYYKALYIKELPKE